MLYNNYGTPRWTITSSGNLVPAASGIYNLGSSSVAFENMYTNSDYKADMIDQILNERDEVFKSKLGTQQVQNIELPIGQMGFDDEYIYVYTAGTGGWKRAPIKEF